MVVLAERQTHRSLAAFAGEKPEAFWLWTACAVLLCVIVWFRVWRLDTAPGLNGDEAWYGVQAECLLHGEPISWRTPTGNPLNPFFIAMLIVVHALAEPSAWALRISAAASGILALVVNYWFCRNLFGTATAIASTVLLAVLPIDIVYGRLAWDACQSLLFTLVALYSGMLSITAAPLRRWRWQIASVAALGSAVLVHPTNVFIAPLVFISLIVGAIKKTPDDMLTGADLGNQIEIEVGNVTMATRRRAVAAGVVLLVLSGTFLFRGWLGTAASRLVNFQELRDFVANFVGLFSGSTVLQYVSGAISPRTGQLDFHRAVYELPTAAMLVICGWGVYRRIRTTDLLVDRSLSIGWGASVLGFFLVAGPRAIDPHWERYGICLVGPTVLLATRGGLWWIEELPRRTITVSWILLAASCIWLGSFYVDFFGQLARSGGESHPAFRTSNTEPKQQALDYIAALNATGSSIDILAGDWWSYWPLRYLSSNRQEIRVHRGNEASNWPEFEAGVLRGKMWYVAFVETPWFSPEFPFEQIPELAAEERRIVTDGAGRPLLEIYRLVPGH